MNAELRTLRVPTTWPAKSSPEKLTRKYISCLRTVREALVNQRGNQHLNNLSQRLSLTGTMHDFFKLKTQRNSNANMLISKAKRTDQDTNPSKGCTFWNIDLRDWLALEAMLLFIKQESLKEKNARSNSLRSISMKIRRRQPLRMKGWKRVSWRKLTATKLWLGVEYVQFPSKKLWMVSFWQANHSVLGDGALPRGSSWVHKEKGWFMASKR